MTKLETPAIHPTVQLVTESSDHEQPPAASRDHSRAEGWLRRVISDSRPRPEAPARRRKRKDHTTKSQLARPESGEVEDGTPYQAQLVRTVFILQKLELNASLG